MKEIEKKVWPQYFEKLLTGVKNYELRLGNFKPNPGDILVLKEWDPVTEKYTGRELRKEVTYSATFKLDELFWPEDEIKKYGLTIVSLK